MITFTPVIKVTSEGSFLIILLDFFIRAVIQFFGNGTLNVVLIRILVLCRYNYCIIGLCCTGVK